MPNCLESHGTIIKEPRWLYTAARAGGDLIEDGMLPYGSLDPVCVDRLEYLFYRMRGPEWQRRNKDTVLEADVTFVETGKTYTFRRLDGRWKEAEDAEPRTD